MECELNLLKQVLFKEIGNKTLHYIKYTYITEHFHLKNNITVKTAKIWILNNLFYVYIYTKALFQK